MPPFVPAQGHVTVDDEPVCDDASAAKYMQSVVPAVLQLLQQLLQQLGFKATGEPWKLPPLNFEGAGSSRSYKHPWEHAAAKSSLETSGLYEASGSVLWCSPWPTDGCDDPQVTMGELRRCALCFQQAIFSSGRACRITFPCAVPVVVDRVGTGRRQVSIQCLARSAHWTCLCASVVVRNSQSPCRSAGR